MHSDNIFQIFWKPFQLDVAHTSRPTIECKNVLSLEPVRISGVSVLNTAPWEDDPDADFKPIDHNPS